MLMGFARVGRPGHIVAGPNLQRIALLSLHKAVPASTSIRWMRHQAFESGFDPDELDEARNWRKSFQESSIPHGSITYARSSGPGGQHVNKIESKATTAWSAAELIGMLPKLLHSQVRSSKYYAKNKDSLSFQAQTSRSRSANADENRKKLFDELLRMYAETVPGETGSEKIDKHKKIEKAFREGRIRDKKQQSAKKQSRRKGNSDG